MIEYKPGYYVSVMAPSVYRDLITPPTPEELAAWEIDDAIDEWCWLQEEFGDDLGI